MPLLTEAQLRRLRANARQPGINYAPAVPLFRPPARESWRFTEQCADDTPFGLCEPGCPESDIAPARHEANRKSETRQAAFIHSGR